MRVPRRDIVLTQCRHCGLVFNRPFDPDVISYAQGYENRQSCSPTFGARMASLVADLTARHGLRGKRDLEIGCGQGDFLTLLCSTAGASGVGYDASYRGPRTRLGGKVRFEDRYVSAAEISGDSTSSSAGTLWSTSGRWAGFCGARRLPSGVVARWP